MTRYTFSAINLIIIIVFVLSDSELRSSTDLMALLLQR